MNNFGECVAPGDKLTIFSPWLIHDWDAQFPSTLSGSSLSAVVVVVIPTVLGVILSLGDHLWAIKSQKHNTVYSAKWARR